MYFLFSKAGNFETSITRVPYNKLLTNLACSSRTGEYWPSVVFVRTSLRSVRTATTSGQYFSVRPSRSVSKRLIISLKIQICTKYVAGHIANSTRSSLFYRSNSSISNDNLNILQPTKFRKKFMCSLTNTYYFHLDYLTHYGKKPPYFLIFSNY